MNLIKTSVLTGIATMIKVVVAFAINKIIAIYAGPSGLAVIGQLQNFISTVTAFSNGAITTGVTKYTAEYQSIEEKQKIFSTSIIVSLVCSSIISFFIFFFSDYLSVTILKDSQYKHVFVVFALTIFLFALNTILMSILNGQKEIKKYILANMSSSLFLLLFTALLIVKLQLVGALYALVLNQSVVFFITLIFVIKSSWFKFEYFKQGIDKDSLKKLGRYSLMAIISAIVVPLTQLLIRNYIGEELSWEKAGYWQGIWYISSVYLMLITTSLRVYYLPRLSEIKDKVELKKEIIDGYKIIMPVVIVMSLVIFIFKEYAILIAFSDKFMPMIDLFKWQLVGDVFKIASWLLAYLMLAKAMTKLFIYTEVGFGVLNVLLGIVFIDIFGLIGITYAYALLYLVYFLFMVLVFSRSLR